jgi:NADPH:quinone reductase
MLAIEIVRPGGPEVLQAVDRAVPEPGADEVLVQVAAAGVNRPDIMQRLGKYPPPPGASDLPGLEIAGTVVSSGPSEDGTGHRWKIGDRVCALVAGGGYAEYCVVPAAQCLPIPTGIDLAAAAAIPETFFTVWANVFQRAQLKAGEMLLVHGGTSGIGTTAIQLGAARGATVLATAGSDQKCDACERLGAAHAINYRTTDFAGAVQELTARRGVDVILDIIGADYFKKNLESLATDGRLVHIGLMGGARAELNIAALMQRRLTLTGSTLRVRTVSEKGAIARDLEEHVWPLLASGNVAPVIHAALPLSAAAEAHRMLEGGDVIGKIVLTLPG